MLGAITGDLIGSIYQEKPIKSKDFVLFKNTCHITDDSILTLAICDGILNGMKNGKFENELILSLRTWAKLYPDSDYGESFKKWVYESSDSPYNSFGNGSAMRVSSVAWIFNDLGSVQKYAAIAAEVTHNHPEGIKGAQAVATCIFLARNKYSKEYIKSYIQSVYGYDLSRSIDEIRMFYRPETSCQKSVPEAITCFLEGKNFEDTIRNAISLGGDSDTLAAIAGSIAEPYFSIPANIVKIVLNLLDPIQKSVVVRFNNYILKKQP